MNRKQRDCALAVIAAAALTQAAFAQGARSASEAVQTYPAARVLNWNNTGTGLTGLVFGEDKRVDVDVDNLTVPEALKKVFDAAGKRVEIAEDVPKDTRITLKARGVRLSAVLALIADTARVGWSMRMTDGKPVYQIGGTHVASIPFLWSVSPSAIAANRTAPSLKYQLSADSKGTLTYFANTFKTRSSFTCPHCKVQTTAERQPSPPACPTCGRVLQGDWRFCPFDATKRPAAANEWKYCPYCGKEVSFEEAAAAKKKSR